MTSKIENYGQILTSARVNLTIFNGIIDIVDLELLKGYFRLFFSSKMPLLCIYSAPKVDI